MALRLRGSALGRLFAEVERIGKLPTQIARQAIYGSRHTPVTNAGTATPRTPMIGRMLHSVWEGPRQM